MRAAEGKRFRSCRREVEQGCDFQLLSPIYIYAVIYMHSCNDCYRGHDDNDDKNADDNEDKK